MRSKGNTSERSPKLPPVPRAYLRLPALAAGAAAAVLRRRLAALAPAPLAAVLHLVPVLRPRLPPLHGPPADQANFDRQLALACGQQGVRRVVEGRGGGAGRRADAGAAAAAGLASTLMPNGSSHVAGMRYVGSVQMLAWEARWDRGRARWRRRWRRRRRCLPNHHTWPGPATAILPALPRTFCLPPLALPPRLAATTTKFSEALAQTSAILTRLRRSVDDVKSPRNGMTEQAVQRAGRAARARPLWATQVDATGRPAEQAWRRAGLQT